jgi:hypothetical protein
VRSEKCESSLNDELEQINSLGYVISIFYFWYKKTAMATLTLEIQDKKLDFFKDLIGNFSFVKVRKEEFDGDSDEEIIENIRQGVKEMRLVEQGKMKSTPFDKFLKELDEV